MNGGFVSGLVLHWGAETAKPFSTSRFIHFCSSLIFCYFILSNITVSCLIRYTGLHQRSL